MVNAFKINAEWTIDCSGMNFHQNGIFILGKYSACSVYHLTEWMKIESNEKEKKIAFNFKWKPRKYYRRHILLCSCSKTKL